MDFFDHQDRARRNTGRLVVLFVLAVLGILASTYLVVAAVLTGASGSPEAMMQPPLLAGIGLGVLAVVGGGSLFKLAQLAAGGQVVALHLGGRLLSGDTRDPVEQRVLNVVEEMAIASGTPVPPVYLLDNEPNINAFAAGYSPGDAVIGITRGCAEKLNRDQLQGVVAHEFSHILNGDMRLNIRLIGILHGILLVGIVGYYLLRSGAYGHRSSSRKGGNPLPLMGLGLMLVGFIGTFFGRPVHAEPGWYCRGTEGDRRL
jgi:Zn-dependent protease with chaperone function